LNSKIILLLGGLISSLIVFFCMKDEFSDRNKKIALVKPELTQKISIPKKKVQPLLKNPKLKYKYNSFLNANLDDSLKNDFDLFAKDLNITKHLNFSQDINKSSWIDLAQTSIKFFQENNITNAYIFAHKNQIEINATFNSKNQYEKYHEILSSQNNISVTDNTNFVILQDHNITKPEKEVKKVQVKPKKTNINIKPIQRKINKILRKTPVYFKFDSDKITKRGKQTLNKIIKILNRQKATFILRVEGHSNAIGDENYNKMLSQKRAIAVKKYLLKYLKNIKSITAKGYGSKKPIMKNPKDRRNRRVEIIIMKGKK